ncbi:Hypothetical protein CINCED_3A024091 [Cinara cedri]|uniref:Uncharacterized protein n=1 Tax=Cinara cedri TaxID=506608 RepID=A0A5E4NEY1_9HEMI|nr:Hypothetical protein CINCED_3A024091 [Cinara cedri]
MDTVKKYIPCGKGKNYIPEWNGEFETLFTSFKRSEKYDNAKKTLESKSWSLLRRLRTNEEPKQAVHRSTQITYQITFLNCLARISPHKQFSSETKIKLLKLKKEAVKGTAIITSFRMKENVS